jgi:hypothetical protein
MVVTQVVLRFDWLAPSYRFLMECNKKVAPNKAVDLPDPQFSIALSASKGSHNYKPGISYLLLEDDDYKPYKEEYDTTGDFIEIQPLPKMRLQLVVMQVSDLRHMTSLTKTTTDFHCFQLNSKSTVFLCLTIRWMHSPSMKPGT